MRLGGVVEAASVVHGDVVAGFGEVLAIPGLESVLGDAHFWFVLVNEVKAV